MKTGSKKTSYDQAKLNNNRNFKVVEWTCNGGISKKNKLLYNFDEVAPDFQEAFVLSGYRKPYSTTWECLQSLFYINNETFNMWSHIVVCLYFVVRYSVVLFELGGSSSPKQDFYYPMLSSAIGSITIFALSATAHTFNSLSEKLHRVFYFFDYAGISIYTYTSGQVMYFYNRPIRTGWRIFESALLYTIIGASLSFLATFLCCLTKVGLRKRSSALRIIPVFAGWLNTVLSLAVGVTMCSCHAGTACQSFIACNELLITYFRRHCFCSILGGLIYGSKLPERLLPGKFDILGSSHHFLHIFGALSTEYAFKILLVTIESRQDPKNEVLAKSLVGISAWETLFPTVVVFVGNIAIASWFAKSIYNSKDEMHSKKK
ncbi:membrane progestin receptor delta-like [Stylophora pistillata]|uniref:membrane progestin receptor delta-like n=1 Tax=Stylophora pistillata TaxID=50429 RepID=UPI000C055C5E|nr:membrane progestin receptor delta-like [Stylophora pistillata]